MAKYKRRPKVKRYHRSFYSRGTRIKRGAGIVVLVLAVLGAAWLAAPHVLDWATHTWYTVVRNRDLEAESASRAASEAAASSAAVTAASSQAASEPEPQFDARSAAAGTWAELDPASLTDDASIRAAARQLKAQNASYALIPLKEVDGTIRYASKVPAASGSIAQDTVDPARIAAILREEEIIPAAKLAAFKDPVTPRTDRSMGIHYEGTMLWLDAVENGKPWLNPYSDAAVQYLGDLVEELQGMGFEQVVLTNVQFPRFSRKQDYGETGGLSRADRLRADIDTLQTRFDGSVTVWFGYPLDQCENTSDVLDAAALTLGVRELLVTAAGDADAEALSALEAAAREAGVRSLALQSAEGTRTVYVSG